MRALTLKPEHAERVADGLKLVENRSWGLKVRGTIAIHRGGPDGAIIALADVIDVLTPEQALKRLPRKQHEYVRGPLCWILANVRRIPPVACRGHLSLWQISDAVRKEIR